MSFADFDEKAIREICRATGLTDERFGGLIGARRGRVLKLKSGQSHAGWGENHLLALIKKRHTERGVGARLYFMKLADRVNEFGPPAAFALLFTGEDP